MNIIAGDDIIVQYLLSLGLKEYLVFILEQNNPDGRDFSLELDTIITSIFFNLTHSPVFDYGAPLFENENILNRLLSKISNKDQKVRKESLDLLAALLKNNSDRKFDFIQKFNLMNAVIYALMYENVARLVILELQIIDYMILKDVQKNYDPEDEDVDFKNVNFQMLNHFINNNGIDAYEQLKERYNGTNEIYWRIVIFENKFYTLEENIDVHIDQEMQFII